MRRLHGDAQRLAQARMITCSSLQLQWRRQQRIPGRFRRAASSCRLPSACSTAVRAAEPSTQPARTRRASPKTCSGSAATASALLPFSSLVRLALSRLSEDRRTERAGALRMMLILPLAQASSGPKWWNAPLAPDRTRSLAPCLDRHADQGLAANFSASPELCRPGRAPFPRSLARSQAPVG